MADSTKYSATWACANDEVNGIGPLYYFALDNRSPGPYKTQRHVAAIVDVASDGTLSGIKLIDNMPPPPLLPVSKMITPPCDDDSDYIKLEKSICFELAELISAWRGRHKLSEDQSIELAGVALAIAIPKLKEKF